MKKIKSLELKMSPIRHDKLPDGFIKRVIKYKEILWEVERTSLEEAISNFQRDLFPNDELIIWEKTAKNYMKCCKKKPKQTLTEKKKLVLSLLLNKPNANLRCKVK